MASSRGCAADSAYSGNKFLPALAKFGRWSVEIVKRTAGAVGFEVLPRRWVVERTLPWLNHNRSLAKRLRTGRCGVRRRNTLHLERRCLL